METKNQELSPVGLLQNAIAVARLTGNECTVNVKTIQENFGSVREVGNLLPPCLLPAWGIPGMKWLLGRYLPLKFHVGVNRDSHVSLRFPIDPVTTRLHQSVGQTGIEGRQTFRGMGSNSPRNHLEAQDWELGKLEERGTSRGWNVRWEFEMGRRIKVTTKGVSINVRKDRGIKQKRNRHRRKEK